MSTQTRRTKVSRRHYSPSASVRMGTAHITLPVLMTLCFLCGTCFVGVVGFGFIALRAETRCDLAQLEVESFKNVLHAHNLPTAVHLPGESP